MLSLPTLTMFGGGTKAQQPITDVLPAHGPISKLMYLLLV